MAKRGEVLVAKRHLGFGAPERKEHFVVLQADFLQGDLETVVVAPLDDDLPVYAADPLVVRVTAKEAGAADVQVVLVAHLSSTLLDRFEAKIAGRLRGSSLGQIDELLELLLDLT